MRAIALTCLATLIGAAGLVLAMYLVCVGAGTVCFRLMSIRR